MGQLVFKLSLTDNNSPTYSPLHYHSCATIDSLPVEILSKIITTSIPLKELLTGRYRLVCRQWNAIIESRCHRERCLMLWDGRNVGWKTFESVQQRLEARFFGAIYLAHFVTIVRPNSLFKLDFCHFLLRLFPNLTQLVVSCDVTNENVDSVIYLLKHWPQLETLSLWNMFDVTFGFKLYRTINEELIHLKRLDLKDGNCLYTEKLAPTLGRLCHLSTGALYSDAILPDAWAHLGQRQSTSSSSLTRLWIQAEISPKELHSMVAAFNFGRINLTHLHLCVSPPSFGDIGPDMIQVIGDSFPTLQRLSIVHPTATTAIGIFYPTRPLRRTPSWWD